MESWIVYKMAARGKSWWELPGFLPGQMKLQSESLLLM
jgi:hypothetical protein